jgi:membrane associated rhomboid family serine protease
MLVIGTERDANAKFPWITLGLICLNVLVYIGQVTLGPKNTAGMCVVAKEIATGKDLVGTQKITLKFEEEDWENFDAKGNPIKRVIKEYIEIEHYPGPVPIYMTLLTSMFMHAGLVHLIGNMWFLWVFGRDVESAMDHALYLLFYIVCGLVAGIVQVLFNLESIIPCLGASGAISGVLAAYGSIFPFHNVKLWLGWLIGVVEIPALFVIGGWLVIQYLFGYFELTNPNGLGGVAYGAHLGGFGAGFLFVWSLLGVLYYRKHYGIAATPEVLPQPENFEAPQGAFPQAPADVYDFGKFYVRPTQSQPNPQQPIDLGNFYPKS